MEKYKNINTIIFVNCLIGLCLILEFTSFNKSKLLSNHPQISFSEYNPVLLSHISPREYDVKDYISLISSLLIIIEKGINIRNIFNKK